MIMAPHFNERQQIATTLITIETTKLFASFRYELSVQETIKGRELHYAIRGLKAPQLSLPSSGSAHFIREFDNLKGKYDIIIESLDGTVNTFTVNIAKQTITLLKSPKTPFIELVVS